MTWEFFKRFILLAREGSVVRRIAWLTVLGLGLSLSAFIIVMSVMTALNINIRERTLAVEPHLAIEVPNAKSILAVDTNPLVVKIKNEKLFRSYSFESQDVILRTVDGRFRGAQAKGLSGDGLKTLLNEVYKVKKQSGHDVEKTEEEAPGQGEVYIGVDLAHALGVFEGDTLTVISPEGLLLPPSEVPKFEKVVVKKIIATYVADVDAQGLFYVQGETMNSLREGISRRLGVEVWTDDPEKAEVYKTEWSQFMNVRIETWRERNSALFFALKLEKMAIGIFLTISGLIACLSLVSVLALLISQKKKEMGLLQAVGMSGRQVRRLFLKMGLYLALIGGGGGFLIGTLVSLWIEYHPLQVLPDIYYDSEIPAKVESGFLIVVALILFLISFLGSWVASLATSGLSPSQALRSKN